MGITFNGYSPSFSFILYILVSCVGGLMILRYLYQNNKPLAAMLCLVLLILVFIFFELRWFQNLRLKGAAYSTQPAQSSQSAASGCSAGSTSVDQSVSSNWPPIINVCPDYMVSKGGNCVDPSQLYGNRGGGNGSTGTQMKIGDRNCNSYAVEYLRWEGVVERDGQCIQSKIPSS
jgi:hypothetical protein